MGMPGLLLLYGQDIFIPFGNEVKDSNICPSE